MDYKKYKLVRDKIPDIMEKNKSSKSCEQISNSELYNKMLAEKLLEEVFELSDALGSGKIADIEDELADVYEVLITLADVYARNSISSLASKKAALRGKFKKGYILKVDSSE